MVGAAWRRYDRATRHAGSPAAVALLVAAVLGVHCVRSGPEPGDPPFERWRRDGLFDALRDEVPPALRAYAYREAVARAPEDDPWLEGSLPRLRQHARKTLLTTAVHDDAPDRRVIPVSFTSEAEAIIAAYEAFGVADDEERRRLRGLVSTRGSVQALRAFCATGDLTAHGGIVELFARADKIGTTALACLGDAPAEVVEALISWQDLVGIVTDASTSTSVARRRAAAGVLANLPDRGRRDAGDSLLEHRRRLQGGTADRRQIMVVGEALAILDRLDSDGYAALLAASVDPNGTIERLEASDVRLRGDAQERVADAALAGHLAPVMALVAVARLGTPTACLAAGTRCRALVEEIVSPSERHRTAEIEAAIRLLDASRKDVTLGADIHRDVVALVGHPVAIGDEAARQLGTLFWEHRETAERDVAALDPLLSMDRDVDAAVRIKAIHAVGAVRPALRHRERAVEALFRSSRLDDAVRAAALERLSEHGLLGFRNGTQDAVAFVEGVLDELGTHDDLPRTRRVVLSLLTDGSRRLIPEAQALAVEQLDRGWFDDVIGVLEQGPTVDAAAVMTILGAAIPAGAGKPNEWRVRFLSLYLNGGRFEGRALCDLFPFDSERANRILEDLSKADRRRAYLAVARVTGLSRASRGVDPTLENRMLGFLSEQLGQQSGWSKEEIDQLEEVRPRIGDLEPKLEARIGDKITAWNRFRRWIEGSWAVVQWGLKNWFFVMPALLLACSLLVIPYLRWRKPRELESWIANEGAIVHVLDRFRLRSFVLRSPRFRQVVFDRWARESAIAEPVAAPLVVPRATSLKGHTGPLFGTLRQNRGATLLVADGGTFLTELVHDYAAREDQAHPDRLHVALDGDDLDSLTDDPEKSPLVDIVSKRLEEHWGHRRLVLGLLDKGHIVVTVVRAEQMRPAARRGLCRWLRQHPHTRVIVAGLDGSFTKTEIDDASLHLTVNRFEISEARGFLLRALAQRGRAASAPKDLNRWLETSPLLEALASDSGERAHAIDDIATAVDLGDLAAMLIENKRFARREDVYRGQVASALEPFRDAGTLSLSHRQALATLVELSAVFPTFADVSNDTKRTIESLASARIVVTRRGTSGIEWSFRRSAYRDEIRKHLAEA